MCSKFEILHYLGGKETKTCLDKYFGQTIKTTGVWGIN
jgi:hypothetical protein